MNSQARLQIGNRISKLTIQINILLSVVKIISGVFGKSNAMISDGIHSLSDVLSTLCVMIGLKLSEKPEDKNHPYGHEKFEPIFTKVLAFILGVTAIFIVYNAINVIRMREYDIPSRVGIYVAILSVVAKEWMYRYTVNAARKIESTALLADAWHHRTDAFSSIGTLIGIIGARVGYPILDSIAALVIGIIILKMAAQIYVEAANQLMDHSADKNTVERIKRDIIEIKGVIKIDELKTRIHASRMYVDVEISVSKKLSLTEAHDIAEKVHLKIENNNKKVKHCMVHVNPY